MMSDEGGIDTVGDHVIRIVVDKTSIDGFSAINAQGPNVINHYNGVIE